MPPRTSQFDPYRTFKFRVRLDNAVIAGVSKVSALGRTVAANEVKQGGDLLAPRQNPAAVSYDEVTLEQGWSADTSFERWANAVTRLQANPTEKRFKRTVYIDVFALNGNLAPGPTASAPIASYKLHRCWVSKYVALPGLDADSAGVGIRSVTLKHEGWERVV
jgi:phage tail-like protein